MGKTKDIVLDGNQLPIREFKLKWMARGPSIAMIAKKGSGKSWICRAIMKHFNDSGIPGGAIIAPTDRMNCFYGKFFPDLYIHYEYRTDILDRILNRQTKMIQKFREKAQKGKKIDPRAFLIMDDCLASKGSWMKDKVITEIFYNGRHYELSYILTMQFPLGISPELRNNFDYVFLLAEDFASNKKRIFEHYAGMFEKYELFQIVFDALTDDFGSMVIVNRGQRKSLMDKIFWFKAGDSRIDKFGCRQFREIHEDNYDRNWRHRGEEK